MSYSYRIGRVVRAHGLSGDLLIQLFRPRRGLSDKKKKGRQNVALTDPETEVEREVTLLRAKAVAPDRTVVHVEGVEDRDAADALEGAYVDVDPAALPTLITDELDALLGAEVVDLEGGAIGEVVDIRDNGAQPLLVIGEAEVLVPSPFITEVREGRVVIDAPPGLIEVNEP